MTPTETTRVREARRLDVLEEIRARFPVEGQKITVRMAGAGLYSRARRAFDGSWTAAVEAAGRQVSDTSHGFGNDAQAIFRNMDAISSNPLPGLPRYLRERQILGGMLLEHFAGAVDDDDNADILADVDRNLTSIGDYLGESFRHVLRRYRLTHMAKERGALAGAVVAAEPDTTIRLSEQGVETGDLELEERAPIEVIDG